MVWGGYSEHYRDDLAMLDVEMVVSILELEH